MTEQQIKKLRQDHEALTDELAGVKQMCRKITKHIHLLIDILMEAAQVPSDLSSESEVEEELEDEVASEVQPKRRPSIQNQPASKRRKSVAKPDGFTTEIMSNGIYLNRPGFKTESIIFPLGFKSVISSRQTKFAFDISESGGMPIVCSLLPR